ALVGYLQWSTAQQKAVLDLFDRRHEIYRCVRTTVAQMVTNSMGLDQEKENKFLEAKERAYFFFGDDIGDYLERLWKDIVVVRGFDQNPSLRTLDTMGARSRSQAFDRISEFYTVGQPLFAKYMRFSQTVPRSFGSRVAGIARQAMSTKRGN